MFPWHGGRPVEEPLCALIRAGMLGWDADSFMGEKKGQTTHSRLISITFIYSLSLLLPTPHRQ